MEPTAGMKPPIEAPSGSALTLAFQDPAWESAFQEHHALRARPHLRRISALVGLALLLMLVTAPRLLPDDPAAVLRLRIAVAAMLGLVAAGVGLMALRAYVRHMHQGVAVLMLLFSALMLAAAARTPPAELARIGYVLVAIHLFDMYVLVRLRFTHALAAGLLTTLAYAPVALDVVGPRETWRQLIVLGLVNAFGAFAAYQLEASERSDFVASRLLERERARSQSLLESILPAPVAERLKARPGPIADRHPLVTVLFADIVGFTPLAERLPPDELVTLLNGVVTAFDGLAARHGLEKIKTIGDAYMAAAGLPRTGVDHAVAAVEMALAMLAEAERLGRQAGTPLALRIGLHSGPLVAGVIGSTRFTYDLWGDTVNLASRMESHGVPGRIQLTEATAGLLGGRFPLERREAVEVRGKGPMTTYLVRV